MQALLLPMKKKKSNGHKRIHGVVLHQLNHDIDDDFKHPKILCCIK